MDEKTNVTKSLSLKNADLSKKIAQTELIIEPIENENKITMEAVNKVEKQIEQLTLLIGKLTSK